MRIDELDGLRGVAILSVLIWHFVGGAVATEPGTTLAYAIALLRLTYAGVDLFFVLSGFLVADRLLASRGKPGFFSTFLRRRASRILPVYLLVVSLVFGARFVLGPDAQPSICFGSLAPPSLACAASFGLAAASWRFLEAPLIDRVRRSTAKSAGGGREEIKPAA